MLHGSVSFMADFGASQVKRKITARYEMVNLIGEPVLIVKHAGESNKPYFNEKLRRAEHAQKRRQKLSVAVIVENRERDLELYPKFIVVGWEKVVDVNGKEVPYTAENFTSFIKTVAGDFWEDEFDLLREFCADTSNFRELADGESAAKNSQTA